MYGAYGNGHVGLVAALPVLAWEVTRSGRSRSGACGYCDAFSGLSGVVSRSGASVPVPTPP